MSTDRVPEQPLVLPQRRERRSDRVPVLVGPLDQEDETGLRYYQLRDGNDLLGHMLAHPECAEAVRSALKAAGTPFPGAKGADLSHKVNPPTHLVFPDADRAVLP